VMTPKKDIDRILAKLDKEKAPGAEVAESMPVEPQTEVAAEVKDSSEPAAEAKKPAPKVKEPTGKE